MADKLKKIQEQVRRGMEEYLQQAHLKKGDLFVVGLSSSEVDYQPIGQEPDMEVGRTIIKTIFDILRPLGIHIAVQGCQHLNRALVLERSVAEANHYEIVMVYPQLHAGGAGQIAAFENLEDPVEVEEVQAKGGIDIGDTFIGMHIKHVLIPVRTSVTEIGDSHVTYATSRPKYIGGPRAKYTWDPFNKKN